MPGRRTLRRIAALYAIETELRGQTAERRRPERQAHSKPLVEAFERWLRERLDAVSGKSPTAAAIRYALSHWQGLIRFLDDGLLELDTNPVERSIRPQATRRSLCLLSLSIWEHWERVRTGNATRAAFSGQRHFDRFRRQVIGADLVRRAGDDLLSGKDAVFDQAA